MSEMSQLSYFFIVLPERQSVVLYIFEPEIKCSGQEGSIETLISDNRHYHSGPDSADM